MPRSMLLGGPELSAYPLFVQSGMDDRGGSLFDRRVSSSLSLPVVVGVGIKIVMAYKALAMTETSMMVDDKTDPAYCSTVCVFESVRLR